MLVGIRLADPTVVSSVCQIGTRSDGNVDFARGEAHNNNELGGRDDRRAADYFISSQVRVEILTTAAIFQSRMTVMRH